MKLILIYYTSSVWCLGCADYFNTVKMAVEQANTNSCCQVVYRDITENPLRTTRQLETLPTMLIVNQDGEELSRRVGFKSEDQLVDWIRFTASPNGF